jgi:hypothetical protein
MWSVSAWAKPGDKLEWAIQDTQIRASGSGQTALGMKSGLVWPVIFTDSQSGTAYSLVPVGGTATGGSWQQMGTGLFSRSTTRMRVASSADGRMAVFGGYYSSTGGGSVYSAAGAWSSLGTDVMAATFDKSGKLLTATRNGIAGLPAYSGSSIVDMAVSSAGDVGVIDSSSRYWQYSPWVGRWLSTNFSSLSPSIKADSLDLEFDSFGRPHIVGTSGSSVYAFDFSTITGTWQASTLATLAGTSSTASMTLIANTKGEVATAWVGGTENNSGLMFSYKPDNGDWVTSVVASDASRSQRQLGMAYDYMDNPVISYISTSGHIILAYDPVVVPEPAVLGLLAVSGVIALRRNRAA